MSTYLNEVRDAASDGADKRKFHDTQMAMAEQTIEIARVLKEADGEADSVLADYYEAAAVILQTQALGLALRKFQFSLADGSDKLIRQLASMEMADV